MPWQPTNPEKASYFTKLPKRCCHLGRPLLTKSKVMHFSWFWSNCSYFILSSTETHNGFAASA